MTTLAEVGWAVTPYLPLALAYAGYRLYQDVKKGEKR